MKFGKIIADELVILPLGTRRFVDYENDLIVTTPTAYEFERAGYVELVETDEPEPKDGFYYESDFVLVDGEIKCVWTAIEMKDELDDELITVETGVIS